MRSDRMYRSMSTAAGAALLALLFSAPGHALPEDREQPIRITADKAVRNEKRGITIYNGNVEMRQGSMELDADSLVVFHKGEDANKIVARGTPARMRQQPQPDEGLVHAHARVITYFRDEEIVNLRTDASVERDDGTLVTGDSIDYFIAKQLITADSDQTDDGNKVFVVIPPSVHREATSGPSGSGTSDASSVDDAPDPTNEAAPRPEPVTLEATGPAPELDTPPGETDNKDSARGRTEGD
ncbi:MAG: lipopolysaccharide transport periplasmic protein LptA [Halioglobus sp.]|nr:lipopolysaccharide transport periplasmic protein LptA [Halioglobus sp.]